MSTTRSVSMIGSITSSDIRDNLLFWIFNVSNEFKFSNADAGNTEILINVGRGDATKTPYHLSCVIQVKRVK